MTRKVKLLISNHRKINLIVFFWILFLAFFILTYFFKIISFSLDFLFSQLEIYFILFLFLFSFCLMRLYKLHLNIDDYSINIKSNNIFSTKNNYIDISNFMLEDYFFLNKHGIFNKILVIKFKKPESKKIIVRRFILTFIGANKITLIDNKLEYIKNTNE